MVIEQKLININRSKKKRKRGIWFLRGRESAGERREKKKEEKRKKLERK